MQLSLVTEPNASQSLSLPICKMRTPAHFLKSSPALNKFSFCQGDTRKKLSYIFKQKYWREGAKKKKKKTLFMVQALKGSILRDFRLPLPEGRGQPGDPRRGYLWLGAAGLSASGQRGTGQAA